MSAHICLSQPRISHAPRNMLVPGRSCWERIFVGTYLTHNPRSHPSVSLPLSLPVPGQREWEILSSQEVRWTPRLYGTLQHPTPGTDKCNYTYVSIFPFLLAVQACLDLLINQCRSSCLLQGGLELLTNQCRDHPGRFEPMTSQCRSSCLLREALMIEAIDKPV